MPRIQVNGVGLHYEDHGAGDPILCIHGTGSSAATWRPAAIEALSALGRLIVYDRRGFSRSEHPAVDRTSVTDHAEDAAALLEALDASPAVVIGRSFGGLTAIELALRHPDRVRGLVLLEAAALSLDAEASALDDELGQIVEAAAAADPASVGEAFLSAVLGRAGWDALPEPARAMFVANSPAIHAEVRGPGLEATLADLATIAVPTMLVSGGASNAAFRRVTELMAGAIPNARSVIVEGGHLIDPGDPVIVEFVRGVLAS